MKETIKYVNLNLFEGEATCVKKRRFRKGIR
jgi:hypothetical protein